MTEKLPPIHPGEILEEDFMWPLGLTAYRVAKDIGVDPPRIHSIISGKRSITADTALRLGHYFGVSAQFWLNLQTQYDLEGESDRFEESGLLSTITPVQTS